MEIFSSLIHYSLFHSQIYASLVSSVESQNVVPYSGIRGIKGRAETASDKDPEAERKQSSSGDGDSTKARGCR
jgi:hypothetical protein